MDGSIAVSLELLGGLVGLSEVAYLVLAAWCVARFRPALQPGGRVAPPLTVMKPLCGHEPHLYECLRSFCVQDHPETQIVCGVAENDDPAAEVVRQLMRKFPERDIALVVDGRSHGTNRKVSNLINMAAAAKHDVFVLSDSDVRLDRHDFLRCIASTFGDPGVGAVTCPYRGLPDKGFVNALGTLHIDDWYFPQTLISARLAPVDFCFGPVTAVRREGIESFGGLRRLADHAADDYMLGRLVARSGYRVELSHAIADTVVAENFASLLRREMRWARTIRAAQPAGHAASIVTHALPIILVLVALRPSALGIAVLGLLFLLRLTLRGAVQRRLHGSGAGPLWLAPVRELLSFLVWLASYAGRDVVWRGRRFAIASDGALLGKLRPSALPNSAARGRVVATRAG